MAKHEDGEKVLVSKKNIWVMNAVQDYKDLSTNDIKQERKLILCEMQAIEETLNEIQSRIVNLKARHKELTAKFEGLNIVLGNR
jgi:hypothetical protein